ncbi:MULTISPECIES: hypothetical protein [unclassified Martelella]|uniref:hypothetical protein n=1 Tax=unclassified Martelella TaxID=2629616 RepID=UPI0025BB4E51|nr:hypothetical protein [Martelella sp.]|tara:strand:+ start:175 stop:483 length:309 start_codon:yes stop_codon:yes gene_type:complete
MYRILLKRYQKVVRRFMRLYDVLWSIYGEMATVNQQRDQNIGQKCIKPRTNTRYFAEKMNLCAFFIDSFWQGCLPCQIRRTKTSRCPAEQRAGAKPYERGTE